MVLYKKYFEIWKHDIYVLPTIRIVINDPWWMEKNITTDFHFLVVHARFVFMRKDVE